MGTSTPKQPSSFCEASKALFDRALDSVFEAGGQEGGAFSPWCAVLAEVRLIEVDVSYGNGVLVRRHVP